MDQYICICLKIHTYLPVDGVYASACSGREHGLGRRPRIRDLASAVRTWSHPSLHAVSVNAEGEREREREDGRMYVALSFS